MDGNSKRLGYITCTVTIEQKEWLKLRAIEANKTLSKYVADILLAEMSLEAYESRFAHADDIINNEKES